MLPSCKFLACLLPLPALLWAQAAVPSPKASSELICNTVHECYPRIFQPTEHFQEIQDHQDLPPGLHVRMNLATGVKEARLNVPEPQVDGDISSALTIIDDSDLVGFKPEPENEPEYHSILDQEDPSSQQPIRPLPDIIAESSSFPDIVHQIKEHDQQDHEQLLPALTDLEDLSHSYHWGLSMAKDGDLVRKLFQLFLPSTLSLEVRSLAALIFGTAIRNNPAALDAALSHFLNDEWPEGPLEAVITALLHEQAPVLLNRIMFLLSSLCQDRTQLSRFLEAGGIDVLIGIYEAESAGRDDKEKLRRKVSHFVVDHLLTPEQEGVDIGLESPVDSEWTMIHLRRLQEGQEIQA
ncbi:MAG: hypothetical protein LQ346_005245 [Caloplaca aetnensis]|nr:MAG: hypothetical protein LQ346_005245 [Caloplaca aetnensis]